MGKSINVVMIRQKYSLLLVLVFIFIQVQSQDTDFLGAGHESGITVTSSSSIDKSPQSTVDGFKIQNEAQLKDASRFLAQTTFGADWATIEMTAAMGYEAWLDEQFELPYTSVVDEMVDRQKDPFMMACTIPGSGYRGSPPIFNHRTC